MTKKEEDIWKNIQFPIITGKLDEEGYANKKREVILDDILNDKETDYEDLEKMEKDFRKPGFEPKTIAQDLISVKPLSGPPEKLYSDGD